MKDVTRVANMLRKAVRSIATADVVITLAFMAIVALDVVMPDQATEAGDGIQESVFKADTDSQITLAQATSATTGKAVFRTSRSTKPKVLDELGSYQLKGIRKGVGEPRAYFRDTKRKQTLTKRVGEMLGPYEIVAITGEGVTVRQGAEEVLLPKG